MTSTAIISCWSLADSVRPGDEIAAAEKKRGIAAGAAALVRILETDHLQDQLTALAWLRTQRCVRPDRIAVAGNSFGGIETVLGGKRQDAAVKIHPACGKSVEEGHAFGYFGSSVWANDAMSVRDIAATERGIMCDG